MSDKKTENKPTQFHEGSMTRYYVEARYADTNPVTIGPLTLGDKWQKIHFPITEDGIGVPVNQEILLKYDWGTLNYSAAQAMRWWVHAYADTVNKGHYLETRLREYNIKFRQDGCEGEAIEEEKETA